MIKTFNFERIIGEITCNTYIIGKVREPFVVVDLGINTDEVIEYAKDHYSKCEAIVLTHAHFDHIRGISRFLKAFPKTPVYVHKDDVKLLKDAYLNGSELMNGKKITVDCNVVPFEDGETLKFESCEIKTIHTPFHTEGSSCLLVLDDNALFTGDTLFRGSIGRSDLPGGDSRKISSSLSKLCDLNENLVCYPGHGEITSLGNEFVSNPYLRK